MTINRILCYILNMTEQQTKKLKEISEKITVILKNNNCGIVPITQIVNNQVSSRVEIVLLEDKKQEIVK